MLRVATSKISGASIVRLGWVVSNSELLANNLSNVRWIDPEFI